MSEILSMQAGNFRAEFLPEVLEKLPLKNIRKLFRLIASEPFQNRETIDALNAYLSAKTFTADLDWKEASRKYAHGWKELEYGKHTEHWTQKKLDLVQRENRKLETNLKQAKRRKERWDKICLEYQTIMQKL